LIGLRDSWTKQFIIKVIDSNSDGIDKVYSQNVSPRSELSSVKYQICGELKTFLKMVKSKVETENQNENGSNSLLTKEMIQNSINEFTFIKNLEVGSESNVSVYNKLTAYLGMYTKNEITSNNRYNHLASEIDEFTKSQDQNRSFIFKHGTQCIEITLQKNKNNLNDE
jgi:hypothetical protein